LVSVVVPFRGHEGCVILPFFVTFVSFVVRTGSTYDHP
jgi:hypothetical protein